MSIPVWIWTIEYPVGLDFQIEENIITLGKGFIKTVQHEVPFTNADGTGQVRSRKGSFVFTYPLTRKNYQGDEKFKEIFNFLMARKEACNESFYFYNPAEQLTPDPTGETVTGRYLVKFLGSPKAVLTKLMLFDFADLEFTEVRS